MGTRNYPGAVLSLTTPTVVVLGDADRDTVGRWLIELDTTGATYSMTPRGRNRAASVDPDTTSPAIPYGDATDSTGTLVAGTTPITGTTATAVRLLYVIADGMSVSLDFSALSAGTVRLCATPVKG